MPAANRPVVVLVMAVLNFVFGGMALLANACCVCGVLTLPQVVKMASKDAPNPPLETLAAGFQELPILRTYFLASLGLGLVLGTMLIMAGAGLLAMKAWARFACIAFAIVKILVEIGSVAASMLFLDQAVRDWHAGYLQKHPGAAGDPGVFGTGVFQLVLNFAIGIAYPIALLIVMYLPNVTAAFGGRSPADLHEIEDYHDAPPDDDGPR